MAPGSNDNPFKGFPKPSATKQTPFAPFANFWDSNKRASSSNDNTNDETQPAKTRFRPDYSDEVLTVLVGPAEKKFVVHKATICRLSNFFKAACSRQWKEGQENLLRLPETDAEAFNVYAHWTYSDNLDMSLMTEPLSFTSPSYLHLGKIWILSNYFGNNALGNLVIDRLLQTMDRLLFHRVSTPTLQYLFTNLPVDSKIRRLFIDAVTATMNGTTFEKEGKSLPQEIVFELARRHAFGQSPQLPGPTFADRCKYHTHDEGEAECK